MSHKLSVWSSSVWLTLAFVFLGVLSAGANPVTFNVTVKPNIAFNPYPEDAGSGSVTFTITNGSTFPVQIACIDNVVFPGLGAGLCAGVPTILYDGKKDMNDMAFNPVLNPTNCENSMGQLLELAALIGACTYKIDFNVADTVKANFNDYGLWHISTEVVVQDPNSKTLSGGIFPVPRAQIYVYDPKAPPVPEPSTWVLMLSAGALCLRSGKRL
jgi:hypothetical protein